MNFIYEVFFNELEFSQLKNSETEPILQAQVILVFLEE